MDSGAASPCYIMQKKKSKSASKMLLMQTNKKRDILMMNLYAVSYIYLLSYVYVNAINVWLNKYSNNNRE